MKYNLCVLFFLLIPVFMNAQNINQVVIDEKIQKPVMKGLCTIEGLITSVWADDFLFEYEQYEVKKEVIEQIQSIIYEYKIVVVIATWCGDSKEHVPPFIKILHHLHVNTDDIIMIGLDRNFDSGDFGIRPYDTEKVPTFIFYKNNDEAGRIIETPEMSLEHHIVKILLNHEEE
jgi:hypothetical protein